MTTLLPDEIEAIRKNLHEEKKRIQQRIVELNKQDPFSDPDRGADNAASDTEAQEESGHDRVHAMVEESERVLSTIENALKRIENNTYGICLSCGHIITAERLRALPTASLCVSCEADKQK